MDLVKRCAECGQPITFVLIVGWVHLALTDGHQAVEAS